MGVSCAIGSRIRTPGTIRVVRFVDSRDVTNAFHCRPVVSHRAKPYDLAPVNAADSPMKVPRTHKLTLCPAHLRGKLTLLTMLCAHVGLSFAQVPADTPQNLDGCRSLAADAARLACYDAIANTGPADAATVFTDKSSAQWTPTMAFEVLYSIADGNLRVIQS